MSHYLHHVRGKRVLIVGDAMLDVYMEGRVNRLSPEAPVPIITVTADRPRLALGGAANTAANVHSLGAEAHLAVSIGANRAGADLAMLIAATGMRRLLPFTEGGTTVKTRVIGNQQHICRLDHDHVGAPIELAMVLSGARDINMTLGKYAAVLVSDYGKGAITPTLIHDLAAAAQAAAVPFIYAPKPAGPIRDVPATLICANEAECLIATGLPKQTPPHAIVEALWHANAARCVVMTRADKGSMAFAGSQVWEQPPNRAQAVDVTGAGDTFLAALTVSLVAGTSFPAALANAAVAAAIAVSRVGAVTVTPDEILRQS